MVRLALSAKNRAEVPLHPGSGADSRARPKFDLINDAPLAEDVPIPRSLNHIVSDLEHLSTLLSQTRQSSVDSDHPAVPPTSN